MKRNVKTFIVFEILESVAAAAVLLFLFYLFILSASLGEVAEGADIPYMAFWHAPAKYLLELLKLL